MDPKNAIEIHNITKSFRIETEDTGKKGTLFNKHPKKVVVNTVLNDISLNIRKGDVLGILGRNGSGKSTLLSIIARIMEPDSGTIERAGKIASILELGMGFHPDMSGRENIYLKGELYGFSRAVMDSKVEKIIEYSGIGKYIDNPVRTYSSGMTGRLAFAVMVNVESDIMLVDEILSVGDASFTAKAKEHFKKLAKSGKTVVFVSHSISDMSEMCNRCIWIENGIIIKDGNAKSVCAEYQNKMSSSPEIVSDLAEAGVAESQYQLAMMYRDGISGFGKSEELYKEWMKQASNQGHTLAQVAYADLLMDEGDTSGAMDLYKSAANKGNNNARIKISSYGRGKDDVGEKIKEIFLRMADTGEAVYQFRCADYLLKIAWSEGEKEEAFHWFMKSAEQGYPNALHQVGIMYRDGLGTARDYVKMIEFLEKACNLGYVISLNLLADIYFQGRLIPKDDKKAFNLYLKAAELGNGKCQYQTAVMYRDGVGTEIDQKKAEYWFEKFSHSIVSWNCMWAGDWARMYYDSETVKEIYHRAADGGISAAIEHVLNIDAAAGNDCTRIIEELKYLAERGNIDAIVRLGNCYLNAIGVKRSYLEASDAYKKAMHLGNTGYITRIGDLSNHNVVCSDTNESVLYYTKSSQYANITAICNLLELKANETDSSDFIKYIEILEKLGKNGSIEALRALGNIYFEGKYGQKDYSKALARYESAARLGDQWCRLRVAEMYKEGKGMESNIELSIKWYLT